MNSAGTAVLSPCPVPVWGSVDRRFYPSQLPHPAEAQPQAKERAKRKEWWPFRAPGPA
jgi:hypothetical protein